MRTFTFESLRWLCVVSCCHLWPTERMAVVAVFGFEVVEPFFSSRLHPYTSLRESVRRNGGRSGSQEPDTEYSAATVSLRMAVSFSVTLGNCRRVHWAIQTGLAGEGLFFGRRRADATSHFLPFSFASFFKRFLQSPIVL